MVKCQSTWLTQVDANDITIALCTSPADNEHMKCNLCNVKLRFTKQGFQALLQHSRKSSDGFC